MKTQMRNSSLPFIIIILFVLIPLFLSADPHWEYLNPEPVPGDIIDIDMVDGNTGYFVTDGSIFMKTLDGGRSWNVITIPQSETGIYAVDFIDRSNGWALGGPDPDQNWFTAIHTTEDGGDSWDVFYVGSPQRPAYLTNLLYYEDGSGWACGRTNLDEQLVPAVFVIENEESSAIVLPEGHSSDILDIFFLNRRFGWAVGRHGYMAYSFDGGNTWEAVERLVEYDLNAVHFSDLIYGWAGGGNFNNSVLLRSANGGESWRVIENNPAETRIVGIHAASRQSAIAVSGGWANIQAKILQTRNENNWEARNAERGVYYETLSVNDNGTWIGGKNGFLTTSPDQNEWTPLYANVLPGAVHSVYFLNNWHGWICGSGGSLLSTMDGGETWREIETETQFSLYNVYFSDPDNGWITGQNSREYHTADGGQTWEEIEIGEDDVNLLVFKENSAYATHGVNVSVSHDGGESWNSQAVIEGRETPAAALTVPAPGVAYIASAGDSLRFTDDGGENWRAVETPFSACLSVFFLDVNNGWAVAGIPGGGSRLYRTRDGGGSWQAGTRHGPVPGGLHFFNEDFGWMWENPARILATVNGGETWNDMRLNVNQIIRRLHVEDPFHLWAAGDGGLIARWGDDWVSIPEFGAASPVREFLYSAYPNPTNGMLNISLSVEKPGEYRYALIDAAGKTISEGSKRYIHAGKRNFSLDLEGLSTGTYWLTVNGASRSIVLIK